MTTEVSLLAGGGAPAPATAVLHVTPYYPPDRIGGVGEVARIIHQGLMRRGYRSQVLTSGTTDTEPLIHRLGRSPTAFFLCSWRYAREARDFDLLHVHHGEALLLLLALRLHRRRPQILAMFHVDVRRREKAGGSHTVLDRSFGPGRAKSVLRAASGAAKALLDRATWAVSDAVTVETTCLREELADLRPVRDVHVIPYGIATADSPLRQVAPIDLLYAGTPGIRKRTHLLPMILERIRREIPSARLRIVGFDRGRDATLAREAHRLGVADAIDFMGPVTSEEVVPHYRSARVLLLPSAYEGLPMVLLEAMREGLPAVATDVSGHPDAVEDGVNGYLVPVDDVEALSERAVFLLNNPSVASDFGRRARVTVSDRFTIAGQLEAYAQLYHTILAL